MIDLLMKFSRSVYKAALLWNLQTPNQYALTHSYFYDSKWETTLKIIAKHSSPKTI